MPSLTRAAAMNIARNFPIVVFNISLISVLEDPEWMTVEQDLLVAEIFTTAQALVLAARAAGHRAQAYDTELGDPDILTRQGFFAAVRLVLRVKAGGLALVAPVCSSWGWPCSSSTMRRKKSGFVGDTSNPNVSNGNLMAHISLFLYTLAAVRGAEAIFENPTNSWIFGPWPQITSDSPYEHTIRSLP